MNGNHENGAVEATESLRQALEAAESTTAATMEQVVSGKGFTDLLGMAAENAVSLTALNGELWDMALRNFRMAGRGDVDRLARRLNRIEDKLEVILQELERLADGDDPAEGAA